MTQFYSTRQVAVLLAIKPDTLQKAIWQGRVNPPPKSPSGQYLWTITDIESAAWSLRCYERFRQWQSNFSRACDVQKVLLPRRRAQSESAGSNNDDDTRTIRM